VGAAAAGESPLLLLLLLLLPACDIIHILPYSLSAHLSLLCTSASIKNIRVLLEAAYLRRRLLL
jgi:hypothetical protein